MIDNYNAEKKRLIDERVLKLLDGETKQGILASGGSGGNATANAQRPPCYVRTAASNGGVTVVDEAFARLAV